MASLGAHGLSLREHLCKRLAWLLLSLVLWSTCTALCAQPVPSLQWRVEMQAPGVSRLGSFRPAITLDRFQHRLTTMSHVYNRDAPTTETYWWQRFDAKDGTLLAQVGLEYQYSFANNTLVSLGNGGTFFTIYPQVRQFLPRFPAACGVIDRLGDTVWTASLQSSNEEFGTFTGLPGRGREIDIYGSRGGIVTVGPTGNILDARRLSLTDAATGLDYSPDWVDAIRLPLGETLLLGQYTTNPASRTRIPVVARLDVFGNVIAAAAYELFHKREVSLAYDFRFDRAYVLVGGENTSPQPIPPRLLQLRADLSLERARFVNTIDLQFSNSETDKVSVFDDGRVLVGTAWRGSQGVVLTPDLQALTAWDVVPPNGPVFSGGLGSQSHVLSGDTIFHARQSGGLARVELGTPGTCPLSSPQVYLSTLPPFALRRLTGRTGPLALERKPSAIKLFQPCSEATNSCGTSSSSLVRNVAVSILDVRCDTEGYEASIEVCAAGGVSLPAGVPLGLYNDDVTTFSSASGTRIATALTPRTLAAGNCDTLFVRFEEANKLAVVANVDTLSVPPFTTSPTDFPFGVFGECILSDNFDLLDGPFPFVPGGGSDFLGPDLTACIIDSVVLGPSDPFVSYRWSDGSTDATLVARTAGSYWLEVTDLCGNVRRDTVTLTREPISSIRFAAPVEVCDNDTFSLGVTNTYATYRWRPLSAGVFPVDGCINCPDFVTVATGGGPYAIELTAGDAGGCTVVDTVRIGTTASPDLTVTVDGSTCEPGGLSIRVTVRVGGTDALRGGYRVRADTVSRAGLRGRWRDDNSAIDQALGAEISEQFFVPSRTLDSVIFWVAPLSSAVRECIDDNNRFAFSLRDAGNASPPVVLAADTTLCELVPFNLAVPDGLYTSIQWSDGSSASRYQIDQAGSVDVAATDACGTLTRDTFTLTLVPHSPVDLGPDQRSCLGSLVELFGGDYVGFSWTPEVAGACNDCIFYGLTVTQDTLIGLQVVDQLGCESSDSLFVEVVSYPVNSQSQALCVGDTVQLGEVSYTQDTTLRLELMSLESCDSTVVLGLTFNPTYFQQETFTFCDQTSAVVNGRTVTQDTAFFEFRQTVAGCDSSTVTVVTFDASTTSATRVESCAGASVTLADGTVLTRDTSLVVQSQTVTGCDSTTVVDYTFAPTLETFLQRSACRGDRLPELGGQTLRRDTLLRRSLRSSAGCDSTVTLNITAADPVDLQVESSACFGESLLLLDSTFTQSGTALFLRRGTRPGCDTVVEATAIFLAPPQVQLPADTLVPLGQRLQLRGGPADSVLRYRWSGGVDALSCTTCPAPEVRPTQSQLFAVEVLDSLGCRSEAQIQVRVNEQVRVFAPSAFSPNGDGANDLFNLFGDPNQVTQVDQLHIFDRWGNLVHSAVNIPLGEGAGAWDGTYQGKPLNPAVFVYDVVYSLINEEQERITGSVTLVR